jgi:uncharacterized membrane protein YccC
MPAYMLVLTILGTIIALVLGLVGWNAWGNRRRRAKLHDAMQRSRMGRPR